MRALAVLLLLPALAGASWQVVEDLAAAPGVTLQLVGPRQQPFPRPPPRSVEASLLSDFYESFNLMQDVSPQGDNWFTATAEQYVATIPQAFVEGEGGLVYDSRGRVFQPPHMFFNRTSVLRPLPAHTLAQAEAECERHAVLASVVQKYGHMYYHFLEETLPRVALLLKAGLPPGAKLLTWGQPYEYEYLQLLGIPPERVVAYDPTRIYCADMLLLPTPAPRITPPREALLAAREALGVRTLPQEERNLVIYVSRASEPTRNVSNEQQLLGTIRAVFPTEELVVFRGGLAPEDAIALFQRAKVVLGPHGAGLSHALFSAPGTALVEFHFLADPPLMFWHSAAALGQAYWLVPVPQAHWMQAQMEVPIDEVVDVLAAILQPTPAAGSPGNPQAAQACPPGRWNLGGECRTCPAGSYAFNSGTWRCKECYRGRGAPRDGAAYCTTCPPGTYSSPDRSACLPCPRGTFSPLAGAWDPVQCLTPQQRRAQMSDMAANAQQLAKLSPVFARSVRARALAEGGAITQAALCDAFRAAGTFGDPYRGPYLTNSTLPAQCQPSVASVPASPDPTAMVGIHPVAGVVVLPEHNPLDRTNPQMYPVDAWKLPLPSPSPDITSPPVEVPSPSPALLEAPPTGLPVPGTKPLVAPATTIPRPAAPLPAAYSAGNKRKVVDGFVITMLCVLAGILLVPATALAARWLWRQRAAARQEYQALPKHRGADGSQMQRHAAAAPAATA